MKHSADWLPPLLVALGYGPAESMRYLLNVQPVNSESLYDWENEQWSAPLNVSVAQLLRVGAQVVQLQFGPRVYVEKPSGGPEWGLRANLTLLFPE